jgi:hypothetical protein
MLVSLLRTERVDTEANQSKGLENGHHHHDEPVCILYAFVSLDKQLISSR